MQLVREKIYQMEQTHINVKQKFVRPALACSAPRLAGMGEPSATANRPARHF